MMETIIGQPEQELIDRLLKHDLERFAERLGYAVPAAPLKDADAARLLNLAERYSRSDNENLRNRALVICGLLWEHRQESWRALPAFIIQLLSRMGLGPSLRMVDPEYDADLDQLSSLGSLVLESHVAARTYAHEVRIGRGIPVLLSKFQRDVWDTLIQHNRVGISAPTSAGKSFVLACKIIDLLSNNPGFVVYIVPTLSLIQQVSRDIREMDARFGSGEIEVLQSYTSKKEGQSNRLVYVLTQERAASALAQSEAFVGAELVVIDEVQNVERSADEPEERSRTLFDVIQEIEVTRNPKRVVISGPRVENIAQLAKSLLRSDAVPVSESLPPVVSVTYAFSQQGKKTLLNQYSLASSTPHHVEIPRSAVQSVIGGQQYRKKVLDFISDLAERIESEHGTLIFSPTSRQATKTAIGLSERRKRRDTSTEIVALQDYVAETVHVNYGLVQCLPAGVAYHHGKVPQHIRIAVEEAFGSLSVDLLACTTTLMQGVNLPAKSIIARNPYLSTSGAQSGSAPRLTAYEFANLRGRAGRLLKDFVGHAIILDETALDTEDLGGDLPKKTVKSGFEERFSENREVIVAGLLAGTAVTMAQQHSDLVVYIRQAILRHGDDALRRLARVGIWITDQEYSTTRRQMDTLDVPREICIASPYWDPVALDTLYIANEQDRFPILPNSPYDWGYSDVLVQCLAALREVVPFYFEKYLESANDSILYSMARSAKDWSTEVPLADLILWGEHPSRHDWEEIDRRLARLQSNVVYDVPKLLRPLVMMQNLDNPILTFMELGAYRPETRRLIELGLPRETAVRLVARAARGQLTVDSDQLLARRAVAISRNLNMWERSQITSILTPVPQRR